MPVTTLCSSRVYWRPVAKGCFTEFSLATQNLFKRSLQLVIHMHSKFIAGYTWHLKLCQVFARLLPPTLSLPLCGWLSRKDLLPRPEKSGWRKAMVEFPQLNEQVFARHLGLLGVMEGASFYFKKFEKLLPSVKFDSNLAYMPDLQTGVLVLTYHHHFNVLLCTFLGNLLKRPVNVLAMDPDLSPLAVPFAWYKDILYREAELQFSGGRYVLVRPERGNSVAKGLRDMVRQNAALVSVHDFGDPFSNGRAISFNVLGRKIVAPVGAIAFAVERKLPVFVTWLDWGGGARFTIKGCELDISSEESVLKGYFSSLEGLAVENPALWEGWPGICDAELA